MDLYEVVGWLGALIVLIAYWLVTRYGTSMLYHVLNATGALGLLVNAVYHRALPSAAVNLVWIGIAVWGIALIGQRRRATPEGTGG
jgi:hypothetical protein